MNALIIYPTHAQCCLTSGLQDRRIQSVNNCKIKPLRTYAFTAIQISKAEEIKIVQPYSKFNISFRCFEVINVIAR